MGEIHQNHRQSSAASSGRRVREFEFNGHRVLILQDARFGRWMVFRLHNANVLNVTGTVRPALVMSANFILCILPQEKRILKSKGPKCNPEASQAGRRKFPKEGIEQGKKKATQSQSRGCEDRADLATEAC